MSQFILYSLLHEMSALRRKLLDLTMPTAQFDERSRTNILEFARALAAQPGNQSGTSTMQDRARCDRRPPAAPMKGADLSASHQNAAGASSKEPLPSAIFSILLPLLLLTPPLFFYLGLASSMALGACAAAVIVAMVFVTRRRPSPYTGRRAPRLTIGAMILLTVVVVCLHFTIAATVRRSMCCVPRYHSFLSC